MKFLVLGSSGMIGRKLCDYLLLKGHDVIGLDLKNGEDEDLRKLDNEILIRHCNNCDFIFFLAFDVGGAKYLSSYQENYIFLENNSRIILETFKVLRLNSKKIIFTSLTKNKLEHKLFLSEKFILEKFTFIKEL